jgi:hypothetical protein
MLRHLVQGLIRMVTLVVWILLVLRVLGHHVSLTHEAGFVKLGLTFLLSAALFLKILGKALYFGLVRLVHENSRRLL